MDKPILNSPDIFPSADVLRGAMGDTYALYGYLVEAMAAMDATIEWKYYRDGKAWLGRGSVGKKTLFWLSAHEGYFRTTFYFTQRHVEGVMGHDIARALKESFAVAKPIGKLIPLQIEVHTAAQLDDLLKLAKHKKTLK